MTKAPELSGCRPFIGFGHPFFIPNHPRFIFLSSLYHLLSSFRSSSTHRYSSSHHPQVIFTIILYSSLLSSFRHPTVHLYIILHHPHLIFISSLHHPSVISHTLSTILNKSNYNSSNYHLTIFYFIFLNKSTLRAWAMAVI